MKKIILKKIWFAVFALFLVGTSLDVNAQSPNTHQRIAISYDVTAYDYETFDLNTSVDAIQTQSSTMKGSNASVASTYSYYRLVLADVKRNNTPLEDALLTNLKKVDQQYDMTNAAVKELYNNTVNMLQ